MRRIYTIGAMFCEIALKWVMESKRICSLNKRGDTVQQGDKTSITLPNLGGKWNFIGETH